MESKSHDSLYSRIGGRRGIETLIYYFYADVRQHGVLGPIFNATIGNWSEHLDVIADFWTQVTGGPPSYSGKMLRKHLELGLTPDHVTYWLELWEFNCHRRLPQREAAEMTALARQIGWRILNGLEGEGSLVVDRRHG